MKYVASTKNRNTIFNFFEDIKKKKENIEKLKS